MSKPKEDDLTKVFVGGLSSTTDEDSLRQYFEQWGGKVSDVIVMRDAVTKRSRGFGFVTFETEEQLETAMKNRPHFVNNKEIDTKRAVPKEFQNKLEAQVSSKKVYVSGIREEHTEDSLKAYFSKFGSVVGVELAVDKKSGERRGFGFVTFTDNDPADKVVLTRQHMINGKRCDCRKALTKEEMAKLQQLEADRKARGQRSRDSDTFEGDRSFSGNGYSSNYYGRENGYSPAHKVPPQQAYRSPSGYHPLPPPQQQPSPANSYPPRYDYNPNPYPPAPQQRPQYAAPPPSLPPPSSQYPPQPPQQQPYPSPVAPHPAPGYSQPPLAQAYRDYGNPPQQPQYGNAFQTGSGPQAQAPPSYPNGNYGNGVGFREPQHGQYGGGYRNEPSWDARPRHY